MRSRRTAACLLALSVTGLAVSGCAATVPPAGDPRGGHGEALNRWVDGTLTPYLQRQLGQHPRFKGEPVLLVSMSGADIEPEIDKLTESIRQRVQTSLIATQGVNLVWRPSGQSVHHHRSLEDLRCDSERDVHYYIGIDASVDSAGELEVIVRALDVEEKAWVSGFGERWRGRATRAQHQALANLHADDYLRGLRTLPFRASESDLMAAYLAHNLSCLIRQQGSTDVVIHPEPLEASDPVFQRTMELVGNYLARFREVKVTANPDEASYVLQGEVHPIHGNLHQLWVVVRAREGGHHLAGADTAAYVRLGDEPESSSPPTRVVSATRVDEATSPREPPSRHQPGAAEPATPSFAPIISSMRLLRPRHPRVCRTRAAWRPAAWQVSRQPVMHPRECFAVALDVAQDAEVFLIRYDPNGWVERLRPSTCEPGGHRLGSLGPGETLRYPSQWNPHGKPFLVSQRPGVETFYAIASSDAEISRRLADELGQLRDPCTTQPAHAVPPGELEAWLASLEARVAAQRGVIDLKALEVHHRY